MPDTPQVEKVIILRGGGRWSCVLADVLAGVHDCPIRMHWLAGKGGANARLKAEELMQRSQHLKIELHSSLQTLTDAPRVDLAIVASATPSHVSDAEELYAQLKPKRILLEKPFADSLNGAQSLLDLESDGAEIFVNYEFRLASYIEQVRDLCAGRKINEIEFEWFDAAWEDRGHSQKCPNWPTHIAYDQGSHIWSIIDVVLPDTTIRPLSAAFSEDARFLRCRAEVEDEGNATVALSFQLSRRGQARRRFLSIHFADGDRLSLDYTKEPGAMNLGQEKFDTQPQWNALASPLTRSLGGLLFGDPRVLKMLSISRCFGSIDFADGFKRLINKSAAELLTSPDPKKREIALQELYAHQVAASSYDGVDTAKLTELWRE